MRTTVDLDESVLREVKRIQKREGKSLGRVVSELVAQALSARKAANGGRSAFHWTSRPMGARVDVADKEAVHALLDGDQEPGSR
jgi:hypothetical protein